MPFDILSGDSVMRKCLEERSDLQAEKERWWSEIECFKDEFREVAHYGE